MEPWPSDRPRCARTRFFERLLQALRVGRRGPKKAIVAVAASMLTAAYFMLRDEKDYHDLGGRYLADRDKHRVTQHLIRRLQSLGVEVEVKVACLCLAGRGEDPRLKTAGLVRPCRQAGYGRGSGRAPA